MDLGLFPSVEELRKMHQQCASERKGGAGRACLFNKVDEEELTFVKSTPPVVDVDADDSNMHKLSDLQSSHILKE